MDKKSLHDFLISTGYSNELSSLFVDEVFNLPQVSKLNENNVREWFLSGYESPKHKFYESYDFIINELINLRSIEVGYLYTKNKQEVIDKMLMTSFDFNLNSDEVINDLLSSYAEKYYLRQIRGNFISANFNSPRSIIEGWNKKHLIKSDPSVAFEIKGVFYVVNIFINRESIKEHELQSLINGTPFKAYKNKSANVFIDFGYKKELIVKVVSDSINNGFTFSDISLYVKSELDVFFRDQSFNIEMLKIVVESHKFDIVELDEPEIVCFWADILEDKKEKSEIIISD